MIDNTKKLSEAGYADVKKSFNTNYTNTTIFPTAKGGQAFEDCVEAIPTYFKK